MDAMDRDYLKGLVEQRDDAVTVDQARYLQGRIDEYCAQNALDQSDAEPHGIDLKLPAGS